MIIKLWLVNEISVELKDKKLICSTIPYSTKALSPSKLDICEGSFHSSRKSAHFQLSLVAVSRP